MLTGNGVAFILRVPGTQHGEWWSMNGWYIFAGTAAVSLLSKYLIKFRGSHIFNPSNFGLVLCFLLLGPEPAEPLDFWWGPMTGWLALALAIIVVGGLAILVRLHLLVIAVVVLADIRGGARRAAAPRPRDDRALAPRAGHRPLLLVGARHLARGPRLPLLHDHRPEDDADGARGRGSLYAVVDRAPGGAADRAGEDGVLGEGRAARRARDRLRGQAAARAPARRPPRPAVARRRRRRGAARLHGRDRRRRDPRAARRRPSRRSRTRGRLPHDRRSCGRRASQTVLDRKTARQIAADLVADLRRRRTP